MNVEFKVWLWNRSEASLYHGVFLFNYTSRINLTEISMPQSQPARKIITSIHYIRASSRILRLYYLTLCFNYSISSFSKSPCLAVCVTVSFINILLFTKQTSKDVPNPASITLQIKTNMACHNISLPSSGLITSSFFSLNFCQRFFLLDGMGAILDVLTSDDF